MQYFHFFPTIVFLFIKFDNERLNLNLSFIFITDSLDILINFKYIINTLLGGLFYGA